MDDNRAELQRVLQPGATPLTLGFAESKLLEAKRFAELRCRRAEAIRASKKAWSAIAILNNGFHFDVPDSVVSSFCKMYCFTALFIPRLLDSRTAESELAKLKKGAEDKRVAIGTLKEKIKVYRNQLETKQSQVEGMPLVPLLHAKYITSWPGHCSFKAPHPIFGLCALAEMQANVRRVCHKDVTAEEYDKLLAEAQERVRALNEYVWKTTYGTEWTAS
jgi:hypothetical protein